MAVVLYMHLGIAKKVSFRMTAMTCALLVLLLLLLLLVLLLIVIIIIVIINYSFCVSASQLSGLRVF